MTEFVEVRRVTPPVIPVRGQARGGQGLVFPWLRGRREQRREKRIHRLGPGVVIVGVDVTIALLLLGGGAVGVVVVARGRERERERERVKWRAGHRARGASLAPYAWEKKREREREREGVCSGGGLDPKCHHHNDVLL